MSRSAGYRALVRALQSARRQNLADVGATQPIPEPLPGWSRRKFLRKASTIAASSSVALGTGLPGTVSASSKSPRIAIVGAGFAGLNAARHLKEQGYHANVFEARHRVGGRVTPVKPPKVSDFILDLGGSFINSDHDDMIELAHRYHEPLFNRIENAKKQPFPKTAYLFDGRLRSEAELAHDLRPLADQISHDADLLDEDFDTFAPIFDHQSVTEYLDLHAGKIRKNYIRVLIENSIRSEYGVEPQQSSALQLLFNLPTVEGQKVEVLGGSDETFFVRDGAATLARGLSEELKGQIHLGQRLVELRQGSDGYYLTFHHRPNRRGASRSTVHADYVVLTLPFSVLRDVDLRLPLPSVLREFIHEGDLGQNEKVFAGFTRRVWQQGRGFAAELYGDQGYTSVWDESQRFPLKKTGVLTFYTGASQVDRITSKSRGLVGRSFVNQLAEAIPEALSAANGGFLKSNWSNDPYSKGAYSSFHPGQLTKFAEYFWIEGDTPDESQEVSVGNLIFAGEQLSDAWYAFMNGAAQTGRLAAMVIVEREKAARPKSN